MSDDQKRDNERLAALKVEQALDLAMGAFHLSRCNLALSALLDTMAALKRAQMALCDAVEGYEVAAAMKQPTTGVEG